MSKFDSDKLYIVEDLQVLLDRLTLGMTLKGRILEALGENKYLLRIRGYNLIIESEQRFNDNDEADLKVMALIPKLKLSLKRHLHHIVDADKGIADIII